MAMQDSRWTMLHARTITTRNMILARTRRHLQFNHRVWQSMGFLRKLTKHCPSITSWMAPSSIKTRQGSQKWLEMSKGDSYLLNMQGLYLLSDILKIMVLSHLWSSKTKAQSKTITAIQTNIPLTSLDEVYLLSNPRTYFELSKVKQPRSITWTKS